MKVKYELFHIYFTRKSIYIRLGSVTKERTGQTSWLVWWTVQSDPVFCSLAECLGNLLLIPIKLTRTNH